MVTTVKDNHLILRGATRELCITTLRCALDKYLKHLTYIALVTLLGEPILKVDNLGQASRLDILGHVISKVALRKGAGALRVLEHIGKVVLHLLHEGEGLAVLLLGLVREACDKVGGDGTIGHIASYGSYTFEVPLARIFAVHALEHLGRARLCRQMYGTTDIGLRGHSLEKLIADILGMRGRKAYTQER